jgi:hypothetical protein
MVIWQTTEIFITSDLFGPQWKEGITEWKTFRNDESRQTKFRAPNQTGGNGERNRVYEGKREKNTRLWRGKLNETGGSKDLGKDGSIILK